MSVRVHVDSEICAADRDAIELAARSLDERVGSVDIAVRPWRALLADHGDPGPIPDRTRVIGVIDCDARACVGLCEFRRAADRAGVLVARDSGSAALIRPMVRASVHVPPCTARAAESAAAEEPRAARFDGPRSLHAHVDDEADAGFAAAMICAGVRGAYAGGVSASGAGAARLSSLIDGCALREAAEGAVRLNLYPLHSAPVRTIRDAENGVPQIASAVGAARDLLEPAALLGEPGEAADLLRDEPRSGRLSRLAAVARCRVRHGASGDRGDPGWERALRLAAEAPASVRAARPSGAAATGSSRVCIWYRFHDPPWGGGNQFWHAAATEMRRRGIDVAPAHETDDHRADAHFAESGWFDEDLFRAAVRPGQDPVVHRLDGPVSMIRRTPESLEFDKKCDDLNRRFATATVIQSPFSLRGWAALGLVPVRPIVLANASDPAVFFPAADRDPARTQRELRDRPLRLVATSWSDNPAKGAAVLEWLDRHADPARVALTFVGRVRSSFERSAMIGAVPSAELAGHLRAHDAYLAASRDDPCSNALIEALTCGLPAVYLRSGGHPELVGAGGVGFDVPDEIPAAIEALRDRYALHASAVRVNSIARVVDAMLGLAGIACA